MRLFSEISYLGKNFHGWQIQPNARSIQQELEEAISRILKQEIRIHGSSRTDTGVHARQQYAHFDLNELPFSLKDLKWKLNSFLPADISVKNIQAVPDDAHSRFDAVSRKYIYRACTEKNPFRQNDVLYLRSIPEIDLMNISAQVLKKHTDFQCFSKVKTDVKTFECTIIEAEWKRNDDILEFHIKANRFLRGMVRAIVGTLLDVGFSKIDMSEFEHIILSKNRNLAGKAAAAHGLTLEEVNYPENYF
jgi:tRNA pseudouridine38-40 synthase